MLLYFVFFANVTHYPCQPIALLYFTFLGATIMKMVLKYSNAFITYRWNYFKVVLKVPRYRRMVGRMTSAIRKGPFPSKDFNECK